MRLPKLGGQCPWGTIQEIRDVGNDCVLVDTPSHGGVFVPDDKLKHIPQELREYAASWSGSQNWYEEDECSAIPLFYLYLHGDIDEAHQTVSEILHRLKKDVDLTPALA